MSSDKNHFPIRRKSRELVLQALFQLEFINSLKLIDSLNNLKSLFGIESNVYEYAENIAEAFDSHKKEIDTQLKDLSKNWTIDRMANVDKNILRLALVELNYFNDIPHGVVINEAIEIAKKYGSNDSSSFVNGILDQAIKR
ncbi:MAG: transcription antitermination factor NusB [Bdellovibrionaceae bacterium]|nr:transcription antitermination factor NusB [Pseudobdellovibrionaceae bacterium]